MNGKQRQFPCPLGLVAAIVLTCCPAVPAQSPRVARGDPSLAIFKKTTESRLDEERARIRKIAEPVLERFRKMRAPDMETDIMSQNIKVQTADAAYQNAKLTREVNEIAVKEYEEGIYLQNLATAEGEVRLAESDIRGSMNEIVASTALFEKIKRISSGSMYDTLAVVQFEARVKTAELSRRKAELQLEMAKSKLNVLRNYEKPKRLSELRADVEKARSDELAKEQTVQLEKTKLAMLKKQAEGIKPPAKFQPILLLLAESIRLDGQIREKLTKLEPEDDRPGAGSHKEIEELGRTLETKMNEAARLFEDLKFSELASDINFAATRPASGTSVLSPRTHAASWRSLAKSLPTTAPSSRTQPTKNGRGSTRRLVSRTLKSRRCSTDGNESRGARRDLELGRCRLDSVPPDSFGPHESSKKISISATNNLKPTTVLSSVGTAFS